MGTLKYENEKLKKEKDGLIKTPTTEEIEKYSNKHRDDFGASKYLIFFMISISILVYNSIRTPNWSSPHIIKHQNTHIIKKPTLIDKVVYFKTNSSSISEEGQKVLRDILNTLADNPKYKIVIVGHSDKRGMEERNYLLALERAIAVEKVLISMGLEKNRISKIISFGAEKPVAEGESSEDLKKNRRVTFYIEPNPDVD